MNDLFDKNEKLHKMKTRNRNMYKVNFANTDRLKQDRYRPGVAELVLGIAVLRSLIYLNFS